MAFLWQFFGAFSVPVSVLFKAFSIPLISLRKVRVEWLYLKEKKFSGGKYI